MENKNKLGLCAEIERITASFKEREELLKPIISELFPQYTDWEIKDIPHLHYCLLWRELWKRYPRANLESVYPRYLLKSGYRRVYQVYWANPYIPPPNGLPRLLWQFSTPYNRPDARQQAKIDAILDRSPIGYGCGSSLESDNPPRQWSQEAKNRNRQRRLAKRLKKKYTIPGLLENAWQSALLSQADYFGVDANKLPPIPCV